MMQLQINHFLISALFLTSSHKQHKQNQIAVSHFKVKWLWPDIWSYDFPNKCLGFDFSELCVVCSFRLVPFLTELRAVMDWVWTDTSLSLSSWICVEDIYAHIFILKCWRESEKVWCAPLWVPVSWEFKTESYFFFWKWLAAFNGCPSTSCFKITISHVCGDLCSQQCTWICLFNVWLA